MPISVGLIRNRYLIYIKILLCQLLSCKKKTKTRKQISTAAAAAPTPDNISIVEACYQLSSRKVDAQSVINWSVVGQRSL